MMSSALMAVQPTVNHRRSEMMKELHAQERRDTSSASSRGFSWPQGKRAALSLSFDDARQSQVDVGVPLLDRLGVKATFYVVPSRMKEQLEGWKKAAASGHEIGNHSTNHPCTGNFPWARQRALEDYTLRQMRREMVDANKLIKKMLGVVTSTFAYPCGQKFVGRGRGVKSYVPLVADLFLAGRGYMDEGSNDPAFCDMAQVLGVPGDNLNFEQARTIVDQTLERRHWLIMAGHEIGDSVARQTTLTSMLEKLCHYALDPSLGLWIDTVHAVATHIAGQVRNAPKA